MNGPFYTRKVNSDDNVPMVSGDGQRHEKKTFGEVHTEKHKQKSKRMQQVTIGSVLIKMFTVSYLNNKISFINFSHM